jgi:ATP-dependent Lon protease
VVAGRKKQVAVKVGDLNKYLGPPRHRHEKAGEEKAVGVSTGMAWTEVGGEILKIETLLMDGKGQLTLTGQLGDVMQESARAALSYIRSNRAKFKLPASFHKTKDIHVHVPMGHIPKDGPSAGVAIVVSMLSALTGKGVPEDIALTGEITLRGSLLPIGGLKEKILAAHRSGVRTVILPKENEKDLAEIPKNIKRKVRFISADTIDEILPVVFRRKRP